MAPPLPAVLALLPVSLATASPAAARRVSVSGQSAGGSMAVQHLFAYSSTVDGAGIAAGSPYGCGALPDRQQRCYYGPSDVEGAIAYARWRASQGQIDDLANLRNTPVLLFNGRDDSVVYTQVMRDTLKQLEAFVFPWRLTTRFKTNAAHVWSIDHGDCSCGSCEFSVGPLLCCDVNDCGYDLSGDMLAHIYGQIAPRTPAVQKLQAVDQWSYMPRSGTWQSSGLERWGLVYVPTGCQGAVWRCRVHVNYHGCILRDWGRRVLWASSLDLNEYGEANDIVMVYPQAAGDERSGIGCWNWAFVRSDPLFDARDSVQLKTVVSMVNGLEAALESGASLEVGAPLPAWLLEPARNASSSTPESELELANSSSSPDFRGMAPAPLGTPEFLL